MKLIAKIKSKIIDVILRNGIVEKITKNKSGNKIIPLSPLKIILFAINSVAPDLLLNKNPA
jgi:hypothetical protein